MVAEGVSDEDVGSPLVVGGTVHAYPGLGHALGGARPISIFSPG